MNHPSRSRRLWAFGTLAGTLLVAGVGCSSTNSLIRGQSPDDAIGIIRASDRPVFRGQTPTAKPKPSHNTKLVSHEGMPVSGGMMADGSYAGNYCPPQQGGYCPPGMCMPGVPCPGAAMGLTGYTSQYRDPGVPVYPPGTGPALTGPGSPGAIVQYPYYTTKGPDDFFLDEDGRF